VAMRDENARSTGPALFVGGWALGQLWLFWVAPPIGAAAFRQLACISFDPLQKSSTLIAFHE
jgi:hypothetical protein